MNCEKRLVDGEGVRVTVGQLAGILDCVLKLLHPFIPQMGPADQEQLTAITEYVKRWHWK